MRLLQLWLVRAWLLVCLATTVGCQFAPQQPFTWPWDKQKTKQQPERVLPVWTDTVLYQTNQPGIRGFGGRIYFYEQDAAEPIEVEGGLAVYVFDADNDLPQAQKPLRKFVFTAEQFSQHMSRTSIGPSYSVWLPWGEVGGPPQRLSLIARFESSQGGTVISDPTIKLLPGIPVKTTEVAQPSPQATTSGVQLASHAQSTQAHSPQALSPQALSPQALSPQALSPQAPSGSAAASVSAALSRRSVGTIDLPPSFQRHLRASSVAGETSRQDPSSAAASGGAAATADALGAAPAPVAPNPVGSLPSDLLPQGINTGGTPRTEPANYGGSRGSRDIRQGSWIQGIAR